MNIIVVGDGKVGLSITAQLSREGHNLTIIDSNPNVLETSVEQYDVMILHGNGASLPVLREAGAEKADLLIAVTSTDEVNMLTCILARRLGTRHTIARVRNPEYAEQLQFLREELGLSMTVNPELAAAAEAYHILQFPSFLRRETFAKGLVEIVELRVGPDSRLRDIPLNRMQQAMSVKTLVCAVERQGKAFIPGGDFVLQEGDKIHVTAAAGDLARLVSLLGLTNQKIHSCMIIGGSRIAYYLAAMLLKSHISVKVIEQSRARCEELSNLLPKAVIIHGDGNRQRLLLEEGLRETDALVTLTGMDEQNIILSLYGSHEGVGKVITKISQTEYYPVIQDMGIESVISPKALSATEVVRYVRAMANATGGSVVAMTELADGQVEALEFLATPDILHLNRPLSETPIRKDILIACIIRHGKNLIPQGNDSLQEGDGVIVISPRGLAITNLDDIFEK